MAAAPCHTIWFAWVPRCLMGERSRRYTECPIRPLRKKHMTYSPEAQAGPHIVEAGLFLDGAAANATGSAEFAQAASTLHDHRVRAAMDAAADQADAEKTLDEMAHKIIELQIVIAARAMARFVPSVHTFEPNLTFGDHSAECDNTEDHFHLAPVFLDEAGQPVELTQSEAEAIGGVIGVFSLSDPSVGRVFSERADRLVIPEITAKYPSPDPDPFFDGVDVSNLDAAAPADVAKALMDDKRAYEFLIARLQNDHGSAVPDQVLDRASRFCRADWRRSGDDDAMKSAIFINEIKFARLAQERFPALSTVSVTTDKDGDFRFQFIGEDGVDFDASADLYREVVLGEGAGLVAKKAQWETFFQIDERVAVAASALNTN